MPTVELLYLPDCPNAPAAREQLRRALHAAGLPSAWTEHDLTAPEAPERVRAYGSPTILVDGRDVTGAPPAGGSACRLYPGSEIRGAPGVEAIVSALRAAR